MSIAAVAWALEVRCKDPVAKLILITLAEAENSETGDCHPSVKLLAERAECSRRTVFNKLALLADQGYIETRTRNADNGRQQSNSYRLLRFSYEDRVQNLHGEGAPSCTGEGANCCTPIMNRNIEPEGYNTRKRANPLPILSKALSPKVAQALIDHRKAKKANLTDHAADLLIAKFEKAGEQLGMTPDQCANMMIERGWQGFEIAWVTQDRQQVQYGNHRPQQKIDPLEELARMKANGQTITGFGGAAQIGHGGRRD